MTVIDLTAPASSGAARTRSGLRRARAVGAVSGAALVFSYSTEELLRRRPLLRLDAAVDIVVPNHGGLRGLASAVTDLGVFALLAVAPLMHAEPTTRSHR